MYPPSCNNICILIHFPTLFFWCPGVTGSIITLGEEEIGPPQDWQNIVYDHKAQSAAPLPHFRSHGQYCFVLFRWPMICLLPFSSVFCPYVFGFWPLCSDFATCHVVSGTIAAMVGLAPLIHNSYQSNNSWFPFDSRLHWEGDDRPSSRPWAQKMFRKFFFCHFPSDSADCPGPGSESCKLSALSRKSHIYNLQHILVERLSSLKLITYDLYWV